MVEMNKIQSPAYHGAETQPPTKIRVPAASAGSGLCTLQYQPVIHLPPFDVFLAYCDLANSIKEYHTVYRHYTISS